MKKELIIVCMVLALTVPVAVYFFLIDELPGEKQSESIDGIMKKLNKGPNAIHNIIGKELRENPVWSEIKPQAEEYVSLTKKVAKLKPGKGDDASWEKLTQEYTNHATALLKATEDQAINPAKEAYNQLQLSCKECHRNHR